jgi:hypothetical protein
MFPTPADRLGPRNISRGRLRICLAAVAHVAALPLLAQSATVLTVRNQSGAEVQVRIGERGVGVVDVQEAADRSLTGNVTTLSAPLQAATLANGRTYALLLKPPLAGQKVFDRDLRFTDGAAGEGLAWYRVQSELVPAKPMAVTLSGRVPFQVDYPAGAGSTLVLPAPAGQLESAWRAEVLAFQRGNKKFETSPAGKGCFQIRFKVVNGTGRQIYFNGVDSAEVISRHFQVTAPDGAVQEERLSGALPALKSGDKAAAATKEAPGAAVGIVGIRSRWLDTPNAFSFSLYLSDDERVCTGMISIAKILNVERFKVSMDPSRGEVLRIESDPLVDKATGKTVKQFTDLTFSVDRSDPLTPALQILPKAGGAAAMSPGPETKSR